MEQQVPQFTLLTQNVDGFHQLAGSRNVVELHGNIRRTKCVDHGHTVDTWPETKNVPPHCPDCHSLLRPDVVWFGEDLPQAAVTRAIAAAQACHVFFMIGTSGTVYPAASFQKKAWQRGTVVVTINIDTTTRVASRHITIGGKVGEVLPAIVQQTWSV